MVGKTKPATQDEQDRMNSIKEYCGCLPCLLEGLTDSHCDIHHVIVASQRVGHFATYGNCPWHHRGMIWLGESGRSMKEKLGPSRAVDRADYIARYGDEDRLLATQNFMLHLLQVRPWQSFATPPAVAEQVRQYWKQFDQAAA